MDLDSLKAFAEDILRRVDSVDLKSYDFSKDPDLTLGNIWLSCDYYLFKININKLINYFWILQSNYH